MGSLVGHNFAEAMVQLAEEKGILAQVREAVESIRPAVNLPEVELFLSNPRIEESIKFEFIEKLLEQPLPQEFSNFLKLVIDRNYGGQLAEILEKVIDRIIEVQGNEIVTLVTAQKLSEEEQRNIQTKLEKLWSVKIFLKYRENPRLLGGAVIMRGDQVYDGSLIGQLNSLRSSLLNKT